MQKTLIAFLFILCTQTLFSQDPVAEELKSLADNDQYAKIIKKYGSKSSDYSAKSLYYIGLAYYMTEDDNNCLKFMDLSISKDTKDPAPHYIKASTLMFMGKLNEAKSHFETAIELNPSDAGTYIGLGNCYYQLEKFDLALKNFKTATEQPNCPQTAYSMIAQLYTDLKQNDLALEAYYEAKTKLSKETDSYLNALYNIGLLETLKGNYDKAEGAFLDLLKLDANDYHTCAKLIQIYTHQKAYDKAKPYREKLYAAHKKGELSEYLKDKFCIDQFTWNEYSVQVFERYENENKGEIYNKIIFYVIDKSEEIVLRVQTEFSPISVEMGGPKYLLCANKGSTHHNPAIGINEDIKYDELKTLAIKLFERYIL